MALLRGRSKAISEILSVVLVTLIGISLVGTAYMYAVPLITKRQDESTTDRVYNYFDRGSSSSISRKFESVVKNGGQDIFISDVSGLWTLHEYTDATPDNNSLEFETFSRVSTIAISTPSSGIDWVSLTDGGSCPPERGIVGLDPAYVVCAKSTVLSDGYRLRYRIWFRELDDASGTRGYKINLVRDPSGDTSGTSGSVRIENNRVYTCSPPQCSKTLIITEVNILLV